MQINDQINAPFLGARERVAIGWVFASLSTLTTAIVLPAESTLTGMNALTAHVSLLGCQALAMCATIMAHQAARRENLLTGGETVILNTRATLAYSYVLNSAALIYNLTTLFRNLVLSKGKS